MDEIIPKGTLSFLIQDAFRYDVRTKYDVNFASLCTIFHKKT